MLSLESSRWSELQHAYGNAADIPALLKQLVLVPNSSANNEPWFFLWSSLAHQGDVYSASFAAVPHVIQILSAFPLQADLNYFQFPAWIEICRQKNGVSVPNDLATAYFEALSRLPALVAASSSRDWDATFLSAALSAIAASKGQIAIAEAIQELSPEVAQEFLQWFYDR